ncbi:hypothetical protein BCV70DRAFT_196984 [Testicularia cyperi]|uniref:Mif2/CENP-C cupin domain-containing protein n=1 Tax=Testicularia cyperi TaxID=1882483 RepID=A0A317XWP8_9BASI|nr:hypothetical protein BCV70DRAFT_196984 [Testicularia cyperi]
MPPQGSRRFHEAGVGSRTGLRLPAIARDDDGFEDLDAFVKASQAAMDNQQSDDDEDDYDEVGEDTEEYAGNSTRTAVRASTRSSLPGSSSMDLQNSSAPSPRSTMRLGGAGSSSSPHAHQSSSRATPGYATGSPRGKSRGRPAAAANITLADDDDDIQMPDMSLDGSRSFDLTALAGDDAAAMEDEDDDMYAQPSPAKTAPSKGLSARQAAASGTSRAQSSAPSKSKATSSSRAVDLNDSDEEDAYDVGAFAGHTVDAQPYYDDDNFGYADFGAGDSEEYDEIPTADEQRLSPAKTAKKGTASATRQPPVSSTPFSKTSQHAKSTYSLSQPAAQESVADPPKRKRGRPPKKRLDEASIDGQEPAAAARPKKATAQGSGSTRSDKAALAAAASRERIEQVRSQQQSSTVDENGLRRSTRQRFEPLEWWRGERIRYGRPSLPQGMTVEDLRRRSTAGEDEFEDDPSMMMKRVPVLDVKEVIRVPRAPGEGTFAGTKRSRGQARKIKPKKQEQFTPTPDANDEDELPAFLDPKADTIQPEDGWDEQTIATGIVIDAETGQETEREIVRTKASVIPVTVAPYGFKFQKIFNCDGQMAAGFLQLPPGIRKPTKPSKDNNFVMAIFQGALRVHIHRKAFTIGPGGIFYVPAGNTYSLENICERDVHVFFAQCRRFRTAEGGDLTMFSQVSDTSYATPTLVRPMLASLHRPGARPPAPKAHGPLYTPLTNGNAGQAEPGEGGEGSEEEHEEEDDQQHSTQSPPPPPTTTTSSSRARPATSTSPVRSKQAHHLAARTIRTDEPSEDEEDDFESSRTVKAKRKFRRIG